MLAPGILGSCAVGGRQGAIEVSVIGDGFLSRAPDDAPTTVTDAVLAGATRPGLVAFDASGQVVPALGESWITTGDGLSTIFRLHELKRANGGVLTGSEVARRLTATLSPRGRNALRPLLSTIEGVVGMTNQVVEVRLRVPRPNLLQLLAQPELAIAQTDEGLGPWRTVRHSPALVRLRARPTDDPEATPASEMSVDLRSERAALAVARFVAGSSDLVLGGTLADWPVVRAASLRPRRLRFDPARGLLGIAITGKSAFLANARNREALAMAIDRPALSAMIGLSGWETREQLLPEQLDSAQPPARPTWVTIDPAARRDEAARRVAQWVGANGAAPILRVALPKGSGWRLVLARLISDWRAIGVTLAVAGPGEPIDLRAIDAVSPNASANWFLSVTACEAGLVCDDVGDAALAASRAAPTLSERALAIAAADDAGAARGSFIALGAPIRWVLVDPSLTRFRENMFAVHPLEQLRAAR